MNRYIPDEIVEEIRGKADVADVIGSYIQIKRAGNAKFKALCPFHQEKTPSFHINSAKQTYHCFGCGKGGDVFRFVMEREGVDFPNAIHMLADRYNVIIPEPEPNRQGGTFPSSVNTGGKAEKDRLYKLNEELTSFYQNFLQTTPDSPVAIYLHGRQLSPDVISNFRIGAAPAEWTAALDYFISRSYTSEEMIESGSAIKKEGTNSVYDRFRNRLIFPIWDEQGRVVGFSARSVEAETQGAKYVNSPETPIFRKSKILYALPLARAGIKNIGNAIICEGQMDTIAMHRAGFNNSVAPQGTAFTDEQARILKRYTDQVLIAFDSDDAGLKATLRTIEILLPVDFSIKVITMPPGYDPDTLFREQGADGIQKAIDNAMDFFDFVSMRAEKEFDKATPWGQSKIVETMLTHISKIKNTVLRSAYCSQLAQKLALPQNAVFQELNRLRKQDKFRTDKRGSYKSMQQVEQTVVSPEAPPQKPVDRVIMKAEEMLLELALDHGTIGKQLAEQLPAEMISDSPVGKALNEVIAMTLNGEWEDAEDMLIAKFTHSPNPAITRILTAPSLHSEDPEKQHDMQQKAFSDCISKIKKFHAQIALDDLLLRIADSEGEEKKELQRLYHQKKKEILIL